MKLRCGMDVSSIVMLLPLLVRGFDPNMQEVLNLAYGAQGGPMITNYNMTQMYNYITQIQGLSAVSNFMLNVEPANIPKYQPLLNNLVNAGIPIYPAFGQPQDPTPINDTKYKTIALGYRNFTDCIQVDGPQEYLDPANFKPADFFDMIEWLVQQKFNNIQLNAWPIQDDHVTAYPFPQPQINSAIENVMGPGPNSPYDPNDPDNWNLNPNRVKAILGFNSTIRIITNYENAAEELILTSLTKAQQIAAFQKTIANISGFPNTKGRIHWTAPWSVNYDPIANGTWPFILNQYKIGNPP